MSDGVSLAVPDLAGRIGLVTGTDSALSAVVSTAGLDVAARLVSGDVKIFLGIS